MDKDRIRELFHAAFNKINNISLAVTSNKEQLRQEGLDNGSPKELKEKIAYLLEVSNRIEDNTRSLNKLLEEIYDLSLQKEDPCPPAASK